MKIRSFVSRVALTGTVAVLASLTLAGCSGAGTTTVPFSDPNAVGYIGLCDQAGHQIRSGSIDTVPFAWRAVSSQAAEAPYNSSYRTAILLAYQPRQGLASGEWSGDELTASSRYTNPAHPMAAATHGDDSLEAFLSDYHPVWNGFIELRMYLGTADAETYSEHYPMLAVQVTGNSWHAVGGGPVDCHSGTAESIESIVLPTSDTSDTSSTTTTSTTNADGAALRTHKAGGGEATGSRRDGGAGGPGRSAGAGHEPSASARRSSSPAGSLVAAAVPGLASHHTPALPVAGWGAIALAGLAVLLSLFVIARRRPGGSPQTVIARTPRKGQSS